MKSSDNVLALLIVALVAIIGIVVMLLAPSTVDNFSNAVGYAAHPIYPSFSAAEIGYTINGNTLSVSDYAIYKTGYYSINGGDWQPFTLTGNTLSGNWLTNTATYNLPSFPTGESYVVIYSCSKTNSVWDCHDNKWQLQIINLGSIAAPSINFIPPTPNNGATINTSSQEITANITDDSNTISSWIDFDKSLVGYWSMDYYSSNGIYDNSSYKNLGLFTGGLSMSNIVTGVRGKALSFDGVSTGLNMGDVLDLGISDYSYSMWIKTNDNNRQFILTKGASGGYNGVRIETGASGYGSAIFGYSTGYIENIRGPVLLADNQWHHIVITFDRDGYGTWYTDGVAGTPLDISAGNNQNIDVTDNLYLASTDHPFNGSVDELMIFNRVLSPSEVKALYDSKINKFDATFTNLANGQHTYTVYAIDGAGNIASSNQRTLNINGAVLSCSGSGVQSCINDISNSLTATKTSTCNTTTGVWSAPFGTCIVQSCISGYHISSNTCVMDVAPPTCTDTCSSLGYICGTQTICGKSVYCGTCTSTGTTYYISTSGSDSNSGTSISNAWKTLAHACSSVTTSGSIIHVTAGEYLETNECILAVGVSIEGEGIASHIKSHFKTTRDSSGIHHAAISMASSSEGTHGDQSISNIKLDGDGLQGDVGILVLRRSNVKIHDCTIVDFYKNGVTFDGCSAYNEPSIWATGNELYNNVMSNCGDADGTWDGGAVIEFGGQDGILVHDNTLSETSRASGHNGNIIAGGYYNKGTKYYKNKSYKNDYDGDVWNFHIESWNTIGGTEVYGNEFHGGDTAIDVGGNFNLKGTYPYSWYIHDNLFTGTPVNTYGGKYAICIEGTSSNDVWVYRNHFLNYPLAVQVCDGFDWPTQQKGIYFGYNILENSGWSTGVHWNNIMEFVNSYPSSNISDVYIYNNVILRNQATTHTTAIKIATAGTVSNFNVKNNIMMHNDNGEFFYISNSGSFNGLYVDHNILYDNANNNNPVFSGNTVSNYVPSNNINLDPMFMNENGGDFHLKPRSPAIDTGMIIPGSTTDYDGKSVPYPSGGAPDIGAFEYYP